MSTPTPSPEQKALYLLAAFRPLVGIMAHKKRTEKAKQCAIICVDEILQSGAAEYEHSDNFWRAVKSELLKM